VVLRAGLVGLGMMGRNHARVLQALEGVELVGVADPAGPGDVPLGRARCVGTVDELVRLGIDLAVVACPTEDHEPVAFELAAAGVHALVEKPLAMDLPAARRIAAVFEQAGLVGAVGHIERFNPAIRSLRARIIDGELGEVYQIATRRLGPFPNRIRDVGVVKDLATHDLDLTAFVADATYRSITAHTSHKAGREHEDLVAATALLDTGVITNHLVNWLTPFKERVVVATGERGCFIADTLVADLTFFNNGETAVEWEGLSSFLGVSEGDMIRYSIPKPEPLRVELEGFRDAIVGRGGEIVTMPEGLMAVAVADAALRSATSNATEFLQEVHA
jgi:UDP-N-acetylglucosamine 3-dehydrogenase